MAVVLTNWQFLLLLATIVGIGFVIEESARKILGKLDELSSDISDVTTAISIRESSKDFHRDAPEK